MIRRTTRDSAQRLVMIVVILGAVFATPGCYLTAVPTANPSVALTNTVSPVAPSATPTMAPSSTPATEPSPTVEETVLPQPTAPPSENGIEAWPEEVFGLINAVRAENDLPPYTYSEQLAQVAQLHALDCLQRGLLDHTGSDGSSAKTRILRSGYDAAGTAEVMVQSASPQEAVNWWMDEVPPNDPHRSTLLGSFLTEIGVAVVSLDNGQYYFVADLARPASP